MSQGRRSGRALWGDWESSGRMEGLWQGRAGRWPVRRALGFSPSACPRHGGSEAESRQLQPGSLVEPCHSRARDSLALLGARRIQPEPFALPRRGSGAAVRHGFKKRTARPRQPRQSHLRLACRSPAWEAACMRCLSAEPRAPGPGCPSAAPIRGQAPGPGAAPPLPTRSCCAAARAAAGCSALGPSVARAQTKHLSLLPARLPAQGCCPFPGLCVPTLGPAASAILWSRVSVPRGPEALRSRLPAVLAGSSTPEERRFSPGRGGPGLAQAWHSSAWLGRGEDGLAEHQGERVAVGRAGGRFRD